MKIDSEPNLRNASRTAFMISTSIISWLNHKYHTDVFTPTIFQTTCHTSLYIAGYVENCSPTHPRVTFSQLYFKIRGGDPLNFSPIRNIWQRRVAG